MYVLCCARWNAPIKRKWNCITIEKCRSLRTLYLSLFNTCPIYSTKKAVYFNITEACVRIFFHFHLLPANNVGSLPAPKLLFRAEKTFRAENWFFTITTNVRMRTLIFNNEYTINFSMQFILHLGKTIQHDECTICGTHWSESELFADLWHLWNSLKIARINLCRDKNSSWKWRGIYRCRSKLNDDKNNNKLREICAILEWKYQLRKHTSGRESVGFVQHSKLKAFFFRN